MGEQKMAINMFPTYTNRYIFEPSDILHAERMTKQMVYMGPAFTLLILWQLPAALGLYWLVTSIFSIIQQVYINKRVKVNIE